MSRKIQSTCPCESGQHYVDCCGAAHDGQRPPASAEALMRARYSAFALGRADWLLASWHPDTRPDTLDLTEAPAPKWIGLRVLRHEQHDENHAIVEFVARYRLNGRAARLHELSRFLRENGRWYYVDGDSREG